MRAATGWKWITGSLHLIIHFTIVNLRLFTTRIWGKFELLQSKNDGVKRIDGTASLSDTDPQGLLWNSFAFSIGNCELKDQEQETVTLWLFDTFLQNLALEPKHQTQETGTN